MNRPLKARLSFKTCLSAATGKRNYASRLTTPTTNITDAEIARLSSKPLYPLTLSDLVKYGRPPLSASALFRSANFSLSMLPARLAHRIQALRNLPFIVVTNPHVAQIHSNYMHSLATLLPFAELRIDSFEKENQFTEAMAGLVQTHSNTIPVLARGFLESRKYISPDAVTQFLDEHLRARIGTRLIAEQHIALHQSSQLYRLPDSSPEPQSPPVDRSSYIGVIDTELKPASIVRACENFVSEICELTYGVRPTVVINGEPDAVITHIPVHVEYIITELLKNAFRATIEKGHEREPIEVTIAPSPITGVPSLLATDSIEKDGSDTHSPMSPDITHLEEPTCGVTIRIRDRGGGISPENYKKIWTYSFTTFNDSEASSATSSSGSDALNALSGAGGGGSSLAGLGYGLPLGRAYAEYFGGGIAVQSLYGWGTDVYLSLRGVGLVG